MKKAGQIIFWGIFLGILLTPTKILAGPKPESANDRYSKARSELPEDLYPLYRYLERIMQFNKVQGTIGITVRSAVSPYECMTKIDNKELCNQYDLPDVSKSDNMAIWAMQVIMSTNSQPNANADSKTGLIRIGKPMLSSLTGKPTSVACVVGHELAHITQNHQKQQEIKNVELDKKYSEKVSSAIENAFRAQQNQQLWQAVAVGLNAFSSGLNASQGNYFLAAQADQNVANIIASNQAEQANANPAFQFLLGNMRALELYAPETMSALKKMNGLGASLIIRTKKDTDQYFSDWKDELMQVSRENEAEADRLGMEYIAKAGLDPKACFEVLDLLFSQNGNPSTDSKASHPGELERKAKLKEAYEKLSPSLKRMRASKVPQVPMLPYIYDKDSQVVRISPAGTPGLKPGKNSKAASADGLLGL